jgi:undecaprenyl-diphosphatase
MHQPQEENRNIKDKSFRSLLPVLSIKLVLISGLFIAAVFLFALIAHEAVFEKEDVFDRKIFTFFSHLTTPGLIKTMKFFTFFGSSLFLFPAYILLITYFLTRRKFNYSINITVIGLTSTTLMYVLKKVFQRNRPDLPLITSLKTYSFPSGHALSSFIFCMILIYLIWEGNLRKLYKWLISILLLLFSLTIGLSRIILKVHYPTDVIAGFCLGLVWVMLSFWVLRKIEIKKRVTEPGTGN